MTDHFELLLKKQLNLHRTLLNFDINLKKQSKIKITEGWLGSRLNLLKEYWEEYKTNDANLNVSYHPTVKEIEYFSTDFYAEAEETYLNSTTFIFDNERSLKRLTDSVDVNNVDQFNRHDSQPRVIKDVMLPPIHIKKFDGSYQNWIEFHSMFKNMIHEHASLTNIQKFHYLKSNLVGEADQLLKHFIITDTNYLPAYQLLIQRYENKRILVNAQLKILFNQPSLQRDTSYGIKLLLDTTVEVIHALSNMEINVDSWDAFLVYLVVQKLSSESHQLWEQHLSNSRELPTFKQLTDFLECRFRTLEAIFPQNTKLTKANPNTFCHSSNKKTHSHHATSSPVKCVLCNGPHSIRQCEQFKAMDVVERNEIVRHHSLCKNCLAQGHTTFKCRSKVKCFECNRPHHTLLHFTQRSATRAPEQLQPNVQANIQQIQPNENINDQTNVGVYHSKQTVQCRQILLATVILHVKTHNGDFISFRALLDQGSQASFITEQAAKRLHLRYETTQTIISGIGNTNSYIAKHKIKINVKSAIHQSPEITINTLILKSLTHILPSQSITQNSWDHIEGLELADPTFHIPSKIDLLLGADVLSQIILPGIRRGQPNTPVAQQTLFGWILSGPIPHHDDNTQQRICLTNIITESTEDDLLKKFWEIEELKPQKTMSAEDMLCEHIFHNTYKRDKDGRYIVRLPFVNNTEPHIGNTEYKAVSRFLHLERRFKTNQELKETYKQCINEYHTLHHMEPIATDQQAGCFLPHHAVLKEGSTTTKLRVVFDASCKSTTNKSLNECLLVGPRLQDNIFDLILRWRKYKFVLTADIEKMYRQVRVSEEDTKYQKIVWRYSDTDPIKHFSLKTVTFGMACAPYLAIKALQQLAIDEKQRYPTASDVVLRDFYVDDLMTGTNNINDAIELRLQLNQLLTAGGFELRKWTSNCKEVRNTIPNHLRDDNLPLRLDKNETLKTLGLCWHPNNDTFIFKICLPPPFADVLTKRKLLSDIAKIYDPQGWLTPVTIKAKIIMQTLWIQGLNWDDPLPETTTNIWNDYRSNLPTLELITIPRWLNTYDVSQKIEFHCFCDASIQAYAAVIYIRIVQSDGIILTNLISSKTKVAPVKQISIPRLELCAAVLGANLLKNVIQAMQIPSVKMFAWTDSTIVLSWLTGHSYRWKTFVANRITEIREIIPANQWRHVPSLDNPADCASRGIKPSDLKHHPLWWHGPNWLCRPKTFWPKRNLQYETNIEERTIKISVLTALNQIENLTHLHRCSSIFKLLRSTAYCYRFIYNANTQKPTRRTGWLTTTEIHHAHTFWIRTVQRTEYPQEFQSLSTNRSISNKSRILNLNPFIDTDGILRVGGRLQNAMMSYDEKYPIILPRKHQFTTLLINQMHKSTMHGNAQLMIGLLRKKYWIPDIRNTIRFHILKCVTCVRLRGEVQKQLMGQLPSYRTTTVRPFLHTGVDYAGPIEIKCNKFRKSSTYKGYIALFVCMWSKAIHIELVSDMTSATFIAAFRRFCSRRGQVSAMYSDNGTTFVGANQTMDKELKQSIKTNSTEIATALSMEGTEWHFIPPGSPHFGGLWEAGVKSTKYHLIRSIKNSRCTYEELTTILTQIEGCLNSRPICPMTNDINELSALTPGHFLIGDALLAIPEPCLLDIT